MSKITVKSLSDLIDGQEYKIIQIDPLDYFSKNYQAFINKNMRWNANKFAFAFCSPFDEIFAEKCQYSNSIGYSFLISNSKLIVALVE